MNKTKLKREILQNSQLSIVQFTTELNDSCLSFSPLFNDLAKQYSGSAKFYTIDLEHARGLDHEYKIMILPTVIFIKDGKEIDRINGNTNLDLLLSKMNNLLGN